MGVLIMRKFILAVTFMIFLTSCGYKEEDGFKELNYDKAYVEDNKELLEPDSESEYEIVREEVLFEDDIELLNDTTNIPRGDALNNNSDLEYLPANSQDALNEKEVSSKDLSVSQKPIFEDKILKTYDTQIPENIVENIKYKNYTTYKDYVVIFGSGINIRQYPSTNSKIVGKAYYGEKLRLIHKVSGEFLKNYNSDIWYKVLWTKDNVENEGYIFSKLGEERVFQFEKMIESIKNLEISVANKTAYISNYQNRTGTAPLYKGKTTDNYGGRRYQSAPAYTEPKSTSDFRYISDGMLVTVIGETNNYYKITTLNFKGDYYVPKKYVSFDNAIKTLSKVVVVDRKNQNEGVFEYSDGNWSLISYTYATTGADAKYKLPTDLGFYMAIQKSKSFLYLDDLTKKIAGYAPYAVRFNGGAYIHGVPVQYIIKNGKRIDPGIQEFMSSIGTVPLSHKCVRNYTSHAKFIYDWVEVGKSAVIVIE